MAKSELIRKCTNLCFHCYEGKGFRCGYEGRDSGHPEAPIGEPCLYELPPKPAVNNNGWDAFPMTEDDMRQGPYDQDPDIVPNFRI